MFVPGKSFKPSLWVRPGAYSKVDLLKVVLLGYVVALPVNIRLGWKGLPGINNRAYYDHS